MTEPSEIESMSIISKIDSVFCDELYVFSCHQDLVAIELNINYVKL